MSYNNVVDDSLILPHKNLTIIETHLTHKMTKIIKPNKRLDNKRYFLYDHTF